MNVFKRWFVRLFCPHPVVKAPPTAMWKMNEGNIIKIECVICGKKLYKKGIELELGKWKEKVCYYESNR